MADMNDIMKALNPNADPDDPWKRTARAILKVCSIILLIIACLIAVTLVWRLGLLVADWTLDQVRMLLRN